MKANQKYTPKYWVCHRPSEDDIIIETLSKSKKDSEEKMISMIGEELFYEQIDESLLCDIIDINLVNL